MQSSVPELMDISKESESVHELYGTAPGKTSFANNCLLARRLVERGVRFIQLFDQGWDHHSGVFNSMPNKAKQLDQPVAALIRDLRQRGLLDKTLIVIGTEFGRTPGAQPSGGTTPAGRDHHPQGFTCWLAGGGIRGGVTHGVTDELGFYAIENPHYVTDIHATLLHQLGLESNRMEVPAHKRLEQDFGHVIKDILA